MLAIRKGNYVNYDNFFQIPNCGIIIISSNFFQYSFAVWGKVRNFAGMNIKQEFGKWFLDVAKYVLTAMLLTAMIDGLSQIWLICVSAAVTMLCLIFGAVLIRKGKDEEDRRELNRQRHREKLKHGGK